MTLDEELAAYRAEFKRTAPPGRDALYDAKVEELRGGFPLGAAIKAGDEAPDFTLLDARSQFFTLSEALNDGPAIVTFYRGGWCPYCNLQLRAYQRLLPDFTALQARLVAISPQLPDGSLSTSEKNALSFDVLSDSHNKVAKAFGLVYALPEELRVAMRSNGKLLPEINGDDKWELPLPATYVIAPNRRVAMAYIDVDYRQRLVPEKIIDVLRTLRAA